MKNCKPEIPTDLLGTWTNAKSALSSAFLSSVSSKSYSSYCLDLLHFFFIKGMKAVKQKNKAPTTKSPRQIMIRAGQSRKRNVIAKEMMRTMRLLKMLPHEIATWAPVTVNKATAK